MGNGWQKRQSVRCTKTIGPACRKEWHGTDWKVWRNTKPVSYTHLDVYKRQAYYNSQNGEENQANENEAECIVAKNRHGETSVVRLGWDGAHTRFSNLDVTHEF